MYLSDAFSLALQLDGRDEQHLNPRAGCEFDSHSLPTSNQGMPAKFRVAIWCALPWLPRSKHLILDLYSGGGIGGLTAASKSRGFVRGG